MAITLLLQGRVSTESRESFDLILGTFISEFIATQDCAKSALKARQALFYISLLLNEEKRIEAYVSFHHSVEDTGVLKAIEEEA